MVGNDVVDLRDADSRPESFRPRFDARVFTPDERRSISRDRNGLARRWAHWAAKEAAFKLTKQCDSSFIFSPSLLSVEFEPTRTDIKRKVVRHGIVRWIGAKPVSLDPIEVRSFETNDWVHVVALPMRADWGAVDCEVESLEATESDPSAAVRDLAIRQASRSLGIAEHRLSVGWAESGQDDWRVEPNFSGRVPRRSSGNPTIDLDGVTTSLSLSLSHHGRFVGFAMTPRIEAAIRENRRRESRPAHPLPGAANP